MTRVPAVHEDKEMPTEKGNSRMHLLLTNDDGIHAPGLRALAERMATFAKVTVVAPDRQQSATSHAITLHKPLHVDALDLEIDNATAYQVNGTPADCVKLGLGALCKEDPPALILSGINSGANLGLDIIYSGTASAAAEGVLQGFPAIALSLTQPPFKFDASAQVAELLVKTVAQFGLPEDTYLNVNIPPGSSEDLRGLAITRTGLRKYENAYDRRVDPLGRTYYWQAGEIVHIDNDPDTDVQAVEQRKVSITPVHFDFTNSGVIATLREWNLRL